jgi:hypothetical protein
MSMLNPTAGVASRRWQAASLSQTAGWYLQHVWQALERFGQRRAAPELRELAIRLSAEGHEAAVQMLRTAQEWSRR